MATETKDLLLQQGKQIETLTKSLANIETKMSKMPMPGHPSPGAVFGVPWARNGEDPMTSRGFSFMKMLGLLTGAVNEDQAKVESDISSRLAACADADGMGYRWGGKGFTGKTRFLAPLAPSFLQEDMVPANFRREMRQVVRAGTDGADADESVWIRKKMLMAKGYDTKALSWLNELSGGALVAPPEMGELIELLRNKEALVNAGARVVPLPPQGRMVYPKQTAASLTYWVGENSPITESQVGTGEVTLQAKKLAVLIKAPNELIRFASPAAEALLRDDMTKSLALGLDFAGLEGAGGDNRPRGIINNPNITTIQSSAPGTNGDKLVGSDFYRMIAAVEEANAEFEGYVMRPKTLYKTYQLRTDAVAQGDAQGPFLFNLIREAGDGVQATIAGHQVTKSTQISQNIAKGTATNLTYIIGGMWSDMLIGMFGAIEFAATTQGDTAFVQDQTWVRGILSADVALRHEAAFCLLSNLDLQL